MKRLALGLMAATLLVTAAHGGTLRSADVPDSAAWVVHLDMTRLAASRMWTLAMADSNSAHVVRGLAVFQTMFGFDPVKDLESVTLYNSNYTHGQGVAVLRGKLSEATIQPYLLLNPDREEEAFGNRTIFSWSNDANGKTWALCIPSPGVAVVAATPAQVKDAIQVLDGSAASLSPGSLKLPALSSVLVVGARRANGQIGDNANAAVLQNADWLTVGADEAAGNVSLALTLGASSPESAAQMEQAIRGIIALTTLSQQQNPQAAALANAISINTAGPVVTAALSYPAESLYALLKARRPGSHHKPGAARPGATPNANPAGSAGAQF